MAPAFFWDTITDYCFSWLLVQRMTIECPFVVVYGCIHSVCVCFHFVCDVEMREYEYFLPLGFHGVVSVLPDLVIA